MSHPPDTSPAPASAGPAARARRYAWTGLDQGSIMGAELVVGILLYGGLGHLLDGWLSTGPWFLLIGSLLGFGSGLYLIWVRSGRMEQQERDEQAAARAAARARSGDAVERGGAGGR